MLAGGSTLSAGDIVDLPLHKCHLAVLSACQTGLVGSASAEAVGLTPALLVAGAARIVSSLWPVDDAATALLITRVYHILIESHGQQSLTSALRNAQIWLQQLTFQEARTS